MVGALENTERRSESRTCAFLYGRVACCFDLQLVFLLIDEEYQTLEFVCFACACICYGAIRIILSPARGVFFAIRQPGNA